MTELNCRKLELGILLFIVFSIRPVKLYCLQFGITKDNMICQDLSRRGFQEIPTNRRGDITDINLSWNIIKTIKFGAFKGQASLVEIQLENNFISEIQEGAFLGLSIKIWSLILKENKLRKLEAKMWKGLKEIVKSELSSNEISNISHDSFGPDLDVTDYLGLSRNKIIHVDANTFKSMLHGPVIFSLHDNKLEWVPCFRDNHLLERDKNRSAFGIQVFGNPLRCQPCSCWDILHFQGNHIKCQTFHIMADGSDAPICQQIKHVAPETEGNTLRAHCCKAIESQPNETCLKNPEICDEEAERCDIYLHGKSMHKEQATKVEAKNASSYGKLNNAATKTAECRINKTSTQSNHANILQSSKSVTSTQSLNNTGSDERLSVVIPIMVSLVIALGNINILSMVSCGTGSIF